MKKVYFTIILASFNLSLNVFGQEKAEEKSDTTRFRIGNSQVIVIGEKGEGRKIELSTKKDYENDTIDASATNDDVKKFDAHWSGFDLGFTTLLNTQNTTNFGSHDYWNNDPAKSINFNFNLTDHKFSIYKNYVGVVTGLGFGFYQVAFKNNYVLNSNSDSVFAVMDTVYKYTKDKLKASYLQIPLLLEFCSSDINGKGFFLDAGVVGGVRLGSKTKRVGTASDGKNFEQINKGLYNLNAFKLDALIKAGYNSWGVYASYSIIPLFDVKKTNQIHPLTFGLSYCF